MSTKSAFAHLIGLLNATPEHVRAQAIIAFSSDALHLVTANNGQPLIDAAQAFPVTKNDKIKGPKNVALADALSAGIQAIRAALPVNDKGDASGWIGAANGPFSKAALSVRTPYLQAHAAGVQAFETAVNASEALADKVEKTEEEKAKAKADKATKAAKATAEATEATINAMVEAGQLTRGAPVTLTVGDMATMLMRAAQNGEIDAATLAILSEVVAVASLPTVAEKEQVLQAA